MGNLGCLLTVPWPNHRTGCWPAWEWRKPCFLPQAPGHVRASQISRQPTHIGSRSAELCDLVRTRKRRLRMTESPDLSQSQVPAKIKHGSARTSQHAITFSTMWFSFFFFPKVTIKQCFFPVSYSWIWLSSILLAHTFIHTKTSLSQWPATENFSLNSYTLART